ncbi:MAG: tRNA (guanosine(37)-N1)-methyltransferase TrmD, partial [Myxococcales bacterium]|nr:tRNA (guanosine(37)-N1)-methyltransferase TrmD [Myxococcales bacterium]
TLFPRMVAAPLEESILGKARAAGLVRVAVTDIRDFAEGKHRVTDDVPYGGGAGMVMKPEPLVVAIEKARERNRKARVILMSPQGRRFDQRVAQELPEDLILVCGRYEGVDERVMEWIDDEISLGDFVLTGGELAALAIVDAKARLVPGVLGNDMSAVSESFAGEGLLEGPQYTRPPEFRGRKVPEILLSGDHAKIAAWRREQALQRTRSRRPDLLGAGGAPAASAAEAGGTRSRTGFADGGRQVPLKGKNT